MDFKKNYLGKTNQFYIKLLFIFFFLVNNYWSYNRGSLENVFHCKLLFYLKSFLQICLANDMKYIHAVFFLYAYESCVIYNSLKYGLSEMQHWELGKR